MKTYEKYFFAFLVLISVIRVHYWESFTFPIEQQDQEQKQEQKQDHQQPNTSIVIGQFETVPTVPSKSSLQRKFDVFKFRQSVYSNLQKGWLKRNMSNQSINEINARPYLVLHIGMHKAASSHIQSMGRVFAEDFHLDNYAFYGPGGVNNPHYVYDCPDFFNESFVPVGDRHDISNCPFSREFKQFGQEVRGRNVNVILSNEQNENNGTDKRAEQFRKLFAETLGFDIRVVYVHRPNYEKRVSAYNQGHKRLLSNPWPTTNSCIVFDDQFREGESCKYPTPPSFVEYYRRRENNCAGMYPKCPERIKLLTASYSSRFPFYTIPFKSTTEKATMTQEQYDNKINKINNNNNDDDIMTRLVCNVVPHANHTCSVMKNLTLFQNRIRESKETIQNNPSLELDYDRLAVRAYEAGLLDHYYLQTTTTTTTTTYNAVTTKTKSTERKLVYNAIKTHVEVGQKSTVKDFFPLVCLDRNELESMYKEALEIELHLMEFSYLLSSSTSTSSSSSSLLSSSFSSSSSTSPLFNQTRFREDFDDYVSNKKGLCSIDVDKTIQDPKWIQFFRSL